MRRGRRASWSGARWHRGVRERTGVATFTSTNLPSRMATALAFTVLLLSALPALRIVSKKPFRDELRERPLLAVVLMAGALIGVSLLYWAWVQWPPVLWGVATLAGITTLGAWVRSRPQWGHHRGLPPGSLGVAASLDAITFQDFYARAAERFGPVFKMAQFHRPVACIADLPLGLEVLSSQSAKLAQPRLPFGRLSPGNYIEFMNDERHTRYRAILRTGLSGRVVSECRSGVADAIKGQLQRMENADSGRGVDPGPFLDRIGLVSMLRVMCGVPVDDNRLDELHGWFRDLGVPRAFAERRPEARIEPFSRLTEWIRSAGGEIRDRIARGDSVERSALSEILCADPAHLEDETILGNLILIVHVTHSNVRGLLGWVLKESVDHPEYLQALRAAATGSKDGAKLAPLATNFVSETLRMHQSEYFYREVRETIRVGEYVVPKGWLLRVCVREAHDNPTVFPEPQQFKPERFAGRSYDKTEYCPFSDGSHSCFGAGLAVMVANSFHTELALGFDTTVTGDGPVERHGNRHWGHWQPNKNFRVSLRTRHPQG